MIDSLFKSDEFDDHSHAYAQWGALLTIYLIAVRALHVGRTTEHARHVVDSAKAVALYETAMRQNGIEPPTAFLTDDAAKYRIAALVLINSPTSTQDPVGCEQSIDAFWRAILPPEAVA